MRTFLSLLLVLLSGILPARAATLVLRAPAATLRLRRAANATFTVQLQVAPARFEQKTPLALEVVEESGAARWLPWLTFVNLESLARLQETFGAMEIDRIEKLPRRRRLQLNARFAATRGFTNASATEKQ